MEEGRLMRVDDENDESRILDVDSSRNFLSFTEAPKEYILLPISPNRVAWDIFIAALLAYYGIAIPLGIGFVSFKIPLVVEVLSTLIFVIDISAQFITAYEIEQGLNSGWIETRFSHITKRYLESWFFIDVFSTIPFDLMIKGEAIIWRLLRLGRLLRVVRLGRIFKRVFAYLKVHPSIVRLMKYVLILATLLHWMACTKFFIGDVYDFDNNWNYGYKDDEETDIADRDVGYQYSTALLWAIWVSTGTGQTASPERTIESVYTVVSTLSGFLISAFIVGAAAGALADLDDQELMVRRKMSRMKAYLEQRHTPDHLTKEIMAFYKYRWARNLDTADQDLFKNLHGSLKRDLTFSLHRQLILKVPLFHDITETCLETIIRCLKPRIYLPSEWVCLRGERGNDMYFIMRGLYEVFPDISKPPVVILRDGQSFGEMSLLMGSRRGASIRSMCHGELMLLSLRDFQTILNSFPIFAVTVKKHSPQIRQSRGWTKIRHAVDLLKALNEIGFTQSFESMMRDLCRDHTDQHSTSRSASRSHVKKHKNEVDMVFGKKKTRQTLVLNEAILPKKNTDFGVLFGRDN